MTRIVLLTLFSVLLLGSCNRGSSGTWKNEGIDKDKREAIKVLNDKLFSALVANDTSGVKALMSKTLLDKTDARFGMFVQQLSVNLKNANYRILDEYNVRSTKEDTTVLLSAARQGEDDYTLNYKSQTKESYVSLLLAGSSNAELMINASYGLYGSDWKLNVLLFGPYSFFGKTANGFYERAKGNYESAYLIDAVDDISIAKSCAQPGGDYFKYKNAEKINQLYDTIMQKVYATYQFPLPLNKVSTTPKVIRIQPEMMKDDFYPLVSYLTTVPLQDTVKLKAENEKIKIEVRQFFPGLEQKKFILYRAIDELPTGQNRVKQHVFIDERK